jgi:hypothetical protein
MPRRLARCCFLADLHVSAEKISYWYGATEPKLGGDVRTHWPKHLALPAGEHP